MSFNCIFNIIIIVDSFNIIVSNCNICNVFVVMVYNSNNISKVWMKQHISASQCKFSFVLELADNIIYIKRIRMLTVWSRSHITEWTFMLTSICDFHINKFWIFWNHIWNAINLQSDFLFPIPFCPIQNIIVSILNLFGNAIHICIFIRQFFTVFCFIIYKIHLVATSYDNNVWAVDNIA